jgi:hypothetical protein
VCNQDTCVYFNGPPSVVIGNTNLPSSNSLPSSFFQFHSNFHCQLQLATFTFGLRFLTLTFHLYFLLSIPIATSQREVLTSTSSYHFLLPLHFSFPISIPHFPFSSLTLHFTSTNIPPLLYHFRCRTGYLK